MMVQAQQEQGEGSAMPTDPQHTPTITQPSTSQPKKTQKPRKLKKNTEVPSLDGGGPRRQDTMGDTIVRTRFENVSKTSNDSLLVGDNTPQSDEDSMKLQELMEFYTKLQQRVLDLENTKTAQAPEITSLKLRVKKLEEKRWSRTHKLKRLYKMQSKTGRKTLNDIDKDAEITLVDETQGRYGDDLMFDTSVFDNEEVFAGQDMAKKEISTASPTETIIADDLTLAQTLIEIRIGKAPEVPFVANDVTYKWGYYLTDGIYPEWIVLMKSISQPGSNDVKVRNKNKQAA
ncbi:putative ribonuclease H-like domain-containing protein [Tanacetum coccineum]